MFEGELEKKMLEVCPGSRTSSVEYEPCRPPRFFDEDADPRPLKLLRPKGHLHRRH